MLVDESRSKSAYLDAVREERLHSDNGEASEEHRNSSSWMDNVESIWVAKALYGVVV